MQKYFVKICNENIDIDVNDKCTKLINILNKICNNFFSRYVTKTYRWIRIRSKFKSDIIKINFSIFEQNIEFFLLMINKTILN